MYKRQVLNSLSETAQNVLANLITIFLGITIATKMQADQFLTVGTLMIMGLGPVSYTHLDVYKRQPLFICFSKPVYRKKGYFSRRVPCVILSYKGFAKRVDCYEIGIS